MKTMNKEEQNNFDILVQAWVIQFVPHIFLIPKHNLMKEGKVDD